MKRVRTILVISFVSLLSSVGHPCSEPPYQEETPKKCEGRTQVYVRTLIDVETDLPKELISISPQQIEIKNSGEEAFYCVEVEPPANAGEKRKALYKVKYQNLYRTCRLQSDKVCDAANDYAYENADKALWYCIGGEDTCGVPLEPSSILFEESDYTHLDKEFKKQTKSHPLLVVEEKYQYKDKIFSLKFKVHLEKNKKFKQKCAKYN